MEAPAFAAVRLRIAQATGGAAEAGRHQDRRGLGPPDPQLRAGQQPHQGPSNQCRSLGDAEGSGRRPRCVHRGVAEAGRLMGTVEALIFDMDGTMIHSMPWHAKSWMVFARRHGIDIDVTDLLARTTGRTGAECMRVLFDRDLDEAECDALVHEKETIYRDMFSDNFAEVAGFKAFAKAAVARGLKIAVGTAGDRHNVEFAMSRLKMDPLPLAIVGGDEGLSGKPTPAIFLEAA